MSRHCGLCLYFRALIFTSLVQFAIQCKNSSHYAKLHLLAKKHFFCPFLLGWSATESILLQKLKIACDQLHKNQTLSTKLPVVQDCF